MIFNEIIKDYGDIGQYIALSICRGNLSPYNLEKMPHSFPARMKYGVYFGVLNTVVTSIRS